MKGEIIGVKHGQPYATILKIKKPFWTLEQKMYFICILKKVTGLFQKIKKGKTDNDERILES